LRLLLELRSELGIVLSVVHFNHKLRGAESDADQEFVAGLARTHDLEFFADSDSVAARAAEERISVETAARELAVWFFRHLLGAEGDAQNPQGLKPRFTVQPRIAARKALRCPKANPSSAQLSPAYTRRPSRDRPHANHPRGGAARAGRDSSRILVEDDDGELCGEIVRPLLNIRHRELEQYLRDIGQAWREDSSNTDERFTAIESAS